MPRPVSFALAILLLAFATAASRADVVRDRAELYTRYSAKLAELADRCETENLLDAATALRGWLPARSADQLTLFLPPKTTSEPTTDAVEPVARVEWQGLHNEQADALMALARQAVVEGRSSIAFEMVVEALRENPNHERARKLLGYAKFQDGWHTPFEIKQLRTGKVWREKFGWLPKAHVERYERGERFALGRWMSADEEAGLRSDLKRGWKIETDHYAVTTNHSLEGGVALASQLETLHALWRQVFAPYLYSDAELLKQFDGKAPRPLPRQHDVVYFRTRDEYNAALRSAQPQIEMTLGIYFDTNRTAYFFAGDEQNPGTLYHEATHQLFQETRSVAPHVGRKDNFWIVEGIACYMESLAAEHDHFTLGGPNAGRMPAARHRLLTDSFYVPLSELVTLGRDDLQRDPRIAMLYSQSAGLSDFLMHADKGRYRDALIKYIATLYAGKATPQTLAETTGQTYEQLDQAYRQFMSAGETVAESPGQAAR
jgi:hypothetical protein